jgi:ABC-type sugar transport system substrate-binding protein
MMDAMIDQAAKMCVKLIPLYYEHSVPILISDIEDFITMGVQGIITQHESQQAGLDALKEAKAAGIVVVNYDTVMPAGVYDYAFTASNHDVGYAIGKMAAEWAKTNLVAKGQQVTIGIVDYPTVPFLVERENGITDALAQLLPEGKIAIRGAAVNLVNGVNVGENFLAAYPNMNLVAGINDGSMQGVYEAFQAGGLGKKDIGLFSCDGTTESLQ